MQPGGDAKYLVIVSCSSLLWHIQKKKFLMFAECTNNWLYVCRNVLAFEYLKPWIFTWTEKQCLHEAPFCSQTFIYSLYYPPTIHYFLRKASFSQRLKMETSSKLNYIKLRCGFLSFSTDKEFQKEFDDQLVQKVDGNICM